MRWVASARDFAMVPVHKAGSGLPRACIFRGRHLCHLLVQLLVRETEAAAVAFVVCHGIDLDVNTASSDYIQLYMEYFRAVE